MADTHKLEVIRHATEDGKTRTLPGVSLGTGESVVTLSVEVRDDGEGKPTLADDPVCCVGVGKLITETSESAGVPGDTLKMV